MKIHGIELTGSLSVTGSGIRVSGSSTSTASFGTLTIAGFGGDSNLVGFSSSIASRIASSEAGGVTSVIGGDGLTDSGTTSKTLNVVGGTGIVANTNDIAIDFSDATLNTNVSGAFVAASSSIATDIDLLQAGSASTATEINALQAAGFQSGDSASLASRVATVEGLDRDDDLNFAGDSGGTLTIDMDSETLTIAGGDNITTAGSGNTLTITNDFTKAGISGSLSATAIAALDAKIISASGDTVDLNGKKIEFANVYTAETDLPSASDNHGMFAHVHGSGLAYFAHAGAWHKLALYSGNVSSSAQIASDISGSTQALSASIAEDIANVTAGGGEFKAGDSASIHTRLVAAESELAETLISASAQLAAEVSGAFAADSESLASRIASNDTDIATLTTASSSFSTRVSAEEANVDALQARNIIAGTGLTGGGTLAADRTLNVVGGTGITANADDIAVDFTDSTLQSNISGAFGAASGGLAGRIAAIETGGTDDDLTIAGDSGGNLTIDFDTETLTIAGGDNITTSGAGNTITITNDFTKAGISGSFVAASSSIASDIRDFSNGNITKVSGSVTSTGSFGRVEASIIGGNSPLQIESDNFTVSTAGVVNASSISATSFTGVFTNVVSSSAQLASDISGAFVAASGGLESRITVAEAELENTLVSASAQIATNVSGAFVAASSSIATDINALQAGGGEFNAGDSASIASRLATEEGNVDTLQGRNIIAGTGLTGGGTLASDRTLNVVGGTGITANADDIAIDFSDSTLNSNISGAFTSGFEFNGVLSGSATSTASFGRIDVNGAIIPTQDGEFDLGSPSREFKDLYLSSASLYIDGVQILSSDSDNLDITTDANQSLRIIETGNDIISMQVANGNIQLNATGNGVVDLDAPLRINAGRKVNSSDGNNIHFGDGLSITGSISLDNGNITLENGRTVDGVDLSEFTASVAAEINQLQAGGGEFSADDSSSIEQRLTTAETELAQTLVSASAQISSEVSGAFQSASGSIATDIDLLQADSGGFSTRISAEEANVDALQARNVIAGTGLTGGGTLAADRTLNVVGGTGITANANDIAVDFTDSTLQANVTGSSNALSSSVETRLSANGVESSVVHTQSVASATWNVNHALGNQYPLVTVWNENDRVIIPATIVAVDANNLQITFTTSITGKAVMR